MNATQRISELGESVNSMQAETLMNKDRLASMDKSLSSAKRDVSTLLSYNISLSGHITLIEGQLSTADSRIVSNAAELNTARADISSVQAYVAELQSCESIRKFSFYFFLHISETCLKVILNIILMLQ